MGPGTTCPRCRTALPEGAVFCNLCGAQIQVGAAVVPPSGAHPAPLVARPGFVAAGRGMAVCHHCGITAPTQRSTCSRCERPIGTSLEAVPMNPDGTLWAEVRCAITCRQCGQSSPIDEPELDGVITCPACNTAQAFDTSAWEEAFALAHAVTDLAGPNPEGRLPTPGRPLRGENPYAKIGVSNTFAEISLEGMTISGGVMKTRNLRLAASPGHPLCKRCGSPLAASAGPTELATRCPGCGDSARYGFEPRLGTMAPGLVGVAAESLRADRSEARLDQTSAGMVISLRCPQCGAGLTVLEGAHSVDCTFCKTSCRVPSRTLLALKKGQSQPAPFWLLFRGPSPARIALERGSEATDERGSDPDVDDDARSRKRRQREKLKALASETGGIEPAPAEEDPRSAVTRWGLQILVPLVMLSLIGLVGFWKFWGAWIEGRTSRDVPESADTQ